MTSGSRRESRTAIHGPTSRASARPSPAARSTSRSSCSYGRRVLPGPAVPSEGGVSWTLTSISRDTVPIRRCPASAAALTNVPKPSIWMCRSANANTLLAPGGFAPAFPERPLDAPASEPVRQAVRHVLAGLEPFPAVAVDRCWNMVYANTSIAVFLEGTADDLITPRSMCCGSACIPLAWPAGSSPSGNGGPICSTHYVSRPRRPPILRSTTCTTNFRHIHIPCTRHRTQ
ncbi:MmyB family transcriptional regulator [Couchioplanes caeruleus]|uniref:MmyB family transcriptional regulator n=1 Tax=Couchioplanes caeruleus TaxID=56438 RepID=UPI00373FCFDB